MAYPRVPALTRQRDASLASRSSPVLAKPVFPFCFFPLFFFCTNIGQRGWRVRCTRTMLPLTITSSGRMNERAAWGRTAAHFVVIYAIESFKVSRFSDLAGSWLGWQSMLLYRWLLEQSLWHPLSRRARCYRAPSSPALLLLAVASISMYKHD